MGIPAIAIDSLIVQGTPWNGGSSSGSVAARDARVGGVGVGAGGVVAVDDDRVDALVRALEPLDVRLDDLAGARLAGADRAREVDG